MQGIGDVVDGGTLPGEFLLYRQANALDEVPVRALLLQLLLKLRRKHPQKFGVAGDKGAMGVGCSEYDGIARGPAIHGTAKVTLKGFQVSAGLHELDTKRLQSCSGTQSANREYPGKAT